MASSIAETWDSHWAIDQDFTDGDEVVPGKRSDVILKLNSQPSADGHYQ